jgi:hypothetical protein
MYYSRLRGLILLGWATTIALVVIAYVVALLAPVQPPVSLLMTSMGAVVGLLSPHLTMVYEFFLSHQPKTNRKLDATVGYTILAMCTLYWLVFVLAVWLGIVSRAFAMNGNGIDVATSLVVAISGTLSFLAIKPTSKLFLLASAETDSPESLG